MIKLCLILSMLFGLTGCAAMSAFAQGTGNGLTQSNRNSQSFNCISNTMGSFTQTNCQ